MALATKLKSWAECEFATGFIASAYTYKMAMLRYIRGLLITNQLIDHFEAIETRRLARKFWHLIAKN